MNQTELELIHRELDGENSPEQSRQLRTLLERDTTARRLYEDLSSLTGYLEKMQMVDPPADLRENVMSALPPRRPEASEGLRFSSFFRDLWATLSARPALGLAYAFAVGLLAGLALFAFLLQSPDVSGAGPLGTLVSSESVEDMSRIHELPISQIGLEGEIAVYRSGSLVVIEVNLTAAEAATVLITPTRDMALRGFRRDAEAPVMPIEVTSDATRLQVDGRDRFVVVFQLDAQATSDVHLQIERGDRVLQDFSLSV